MKKIAALCALVTVLGTTPALAKMVSYVDENGKVHYVNTDYAKVPDRYLPQVQGQIPAEEQASEMLQPEEPAQPVQNPTPIPAENLKLQSLEKKPETKFFVSQNCPACLFAEGILQQQGLPYTKYFIDDGGVGQQLYLELQLTSVPATVIGEQIIYGANASGMSNALYDKGEGNDFIKALKR